MTAPDGPPPPVSPAPLTVNGSVDVRFTLWDSDVGGTQIGNRNSFSNYPLTDGRFALGLNFGNGAFNGDQRWVRRRRMRCTP
jgi:hypothetical protein